MYSPRAITSVLFFLLLVNVLYKPLRLNMRSHDIAVASALLASTGRAALFESIVTLNDGSPVQGYAAFNSSPVNMTLTNWANVGFWKGIPYGADTTGNNRFRPPQAVAGWNTTLEAREQGNACPASGTTYTTISEDCLNLNVWSAANSTEDKLPVVMWNYPAGGSAADPRFDGGGRKYPRSLHHSMPNH